MKMKNLFKRNVLLRRSVGEEIFVWFLAAIFLLYTFTLFYPLYWAIISAVKTPFEFPRNVYGLPMEWHFENFLAVFDIKVGNANVFDMFLNSVIVTCGALIIAILECTMTGYIFSKYKFPGSKAIYNFMILIQLIPIAGSTAALYRFYVQTGLYDTRIGLIILYTGGFGYPFLLMYNFFESVSWSYAEAAQIDGAGDWMVFFKIMLPQAAGMMFAIAMMQFLSIYGDYTNGYLLTKTNPTLPVGIYTLKSRLEGQSKYPIAFAALLVTCVPTWIFYLLTTKSLYSLKIDTGIKG